MRIEYTPEEIAEAEGMGLLPFHRYRTSEAAALLELDLPRLRHLITTGELRKVRHLGTDFVVGAELARWRQAARDLHPRWCRAPESTVHGKISHER